MRVDQRDDRGATMVLMAVLLVAVCGLGALMVDVGTVYTEGRQLQNGAEAAAVAVAESCAEVPCLATTGDALADGDAMDGASQVEVVCGTAPGLAGCSSTGARDRLGCRPLSASPSPAPPYVQVQTRTDDGAGGTLLPGFFIQVLDPFMNPDYNGTTVRTCARAAYGTPSGLVGELPLAISTCELTYWRNLHGLVEPPFAAAKEAVLFFHDTGGGGPSNCPDRSTNNSNQDAPGGFGWLVTGGTCRVATTLTGDGTEKAGNSVPGDCQPEDFAAMLGSVVHIPIYTAVQNSTYDIAGYAAFHLSGYRLSGAPALTRASPNLGVPCPSSSRCISGWFTTDAVPGTGPLVPGNPNYGTTAVRLVG